jgi:hypothetical protein
MKRHIIILTILAFTTQGMFAQTQSPNPTSVGTVKGTGTFTKSAADKLNITVLLTDEQYVDVITAYNRYFNLNADLEYGHAATKHAPGEKEALKGTPGTVLTPGPTAEEISTELNKQLKSILTLAQWQKALLAGLVGAGGQ